MTYHDLVMFGVERAYARFKVGDQFVASTYDHEYNLDKNGTTVSREEFVARHIGHDWLARGTSEPLSVAAVRPAGRAIYRLHRAAEGRQHSTGRVLTTDFEPRPAKRTISGVEPFEHFDVPPKWGPNYARTVQAVRSPDSYQGRDGWPHSSPRSSSRPWSRARTPGTWDSITSSGARRRAYPERTQRPPSERLRRSAQGGQSLLRHLIQGFSTPASSCRKRRLTCGNAPRPQRSPADKQQDLALRTAPLRQDRAPPRLSPHPDTMTGPAAAGRRRRAD
jgi:hypothetical protein